MPLFDHFQPPIYPQRQISSFLCNWATRLADFLNERMTSDFSALEFVRSRSRVWIDIDECEQAVPGPGHTMPTVFPDTYEVCVNRTVDSNQLVAAIELISPGNKDRPDQRRAFATKCANYLYQGVSLIIIDIVTNRRANLHNEVIQIMSAADEFRLPAETDLYAVAYRPVLRQERPEIDLWPATFAVGGTLPTLPLRLTGDLFVPVEFEATYQEACRRRRLA
jgi:hypothetical protein